MSNDDARLRALFADAPMPPMGDERFVQTTMKAVARAQARRQATFDSLRLALVVLGVLLLAPHVGSVLAGLQAFGVSSLASMSAQAAPMAGFAGLGLVGLLVLGGWIAAET